MDVCIHTDKGHIIEMGEDDFGRLHSDSGESTDGFEGVRDFSSMFVHELFCGHEEVFRLHSIVVHTSEHHLHFLGFEFQEIGRSFHELEESFRRFIDSFIRHLSGEHDGSEELKWRLEIQLNQLRRIEFEYILEYLITLGSGSDFHEIHRTEEGWKCKVSMCVSFFDKIVAKYSDAGYNNPNEEKNTASFFPGEADSVYSGGGIFFIALPHTSLLRSSIPRVSLRCPLRRGDRGGDARHYASRFPADAECRW
jgi:hypothetical protein